ncbi:MAG: class I SAM-dependent methyltransferase [Gaiellaceae bacterium]
MSTRFDQYRDSYRDEVEGSFSFIGQDLSFFTEVKTQALLELVGDRLGDPKDLRALDVGCGPGETDALLSDFGELHGVDVSAELIARAREKNPSATYAHYDGRTLPYQDGSFDFAFAINVVHHVPPAQWPTFAAELARVLRPGGVAALVEHNPLNPLTRLAVARCEFDDDAVLLSRRRALGLLRAAGLKPVESRYILFFPWRRTVLRRLERRLGALPAGAQYVVAGHRP